MRICEAHDVGVAAPANAKEVLFVSQAKLRRSLATNSSPIIRKRASLRAVLHLVQTELQKLDCDGTVMYVTTLHKRGFFYSLTFLVFTLQFF